MTISSAKRSITHATDSTRSGCNADALGHSTAIAGLGNRAVLK
jgi:hypothetical protein